MPQLRKVEEIGAASGKEMEEPHRSRPRRRAPDPAPELDEADDAGRTQA